jgi:hypothetical protein
MPKRPRPILAVRLIGPAPVVITQAVALVAQLTATYGRSATCRTSTHHASYAGEVRMYVTVSQKETE